MTENPFIPDYEEPPSPPAELYKYVVADRLDVIANLRIRFTPLLHTNDIFEVRKTYSQLAGPRFSAAFAHELRNIDVNTELSKFLTEQHGLDGGEAAAVAPRLLSMALGEDYVRVLQQVIEVQFNERIVPELNDLAIADSLLEQFASNRVVLSLTEVPDNPVMWAHYAGGGTGFVIAFNTASPFFTRTSGGDPRKLLKVTYYDEMMEELFENPLRAINSKTRDWAYEREWRIYAHARDADEVIALEHDQSDVHLFTLPPESINAVILGYNAHDEMARRLRDLQSQVLPHAKLLRLIPDRYSARFIREAI